MVGKNNILASDGAVGSAIRDTDHSGHMRVITGYERMVGKKKKLRETGARPTPPRHFESHGHAEG
jgi:hypothetical protein